MAPPTITSIAPNVGVFTGGTAVTITGSGFTDSAHTTVFFGNVQATAVVVVSPTQITAVSPACPLGGVPVDVSVQNQNGTSSNSNADWFYYFSTIVSLTDTRGNPLAQIQPGETFVINGKGFGTPGTQVPLVLSPGVPTVIVGPPNVCTYPISEDGGSWIRGIIPWPILQSSDTQITMVMPPIFSGFPGTYWIFVSIIVANTSNLENAAFAVGGPSSNFVPFTIPPPPPPGPTPNVVSVTDSQGNVISTESDGSIYLNQNLSPGDTIFINGTNFGTSPGSINYYNPPPSNVSYAGFGSPWMGFGYAAILSWSDTSIELQLSSGLYGEANSMAFEIEIASAQENTPWSNPIFLTVAGQDPLPIIESVTDLNGNTISEADCNSWIIINGKNFGSTQGTVEWEFNYAINSRDIAWWSDTQICVLPPALSCRGSYTSSGFWIRVIDSAGNPSSSILSGSLSVDAFPFTLNCTPPPVYLYAVNAYDCSISTADISSGPGQLDLSPVSITLLQGALFPGSSNPPNPPGSSPAGSLYFGSLGTNSIAIPMGIVASPDGKHVYVSIQIWQEGSITGSSTIPYLTWAGVSGLVPTNGLVAKINTDPNKSVTYNKIIGFYQVGINPQGLVISPDGSHLYVANVGQPIGLGGNGSISVIDLDPSNFKAESLNNPSLNDGAVTTLLTPLPLAGGGSTSQIQSPVELVVNPNYPYLYILDGYNNNVLVLDINQNSATLNQVIATVSIPGDPVPQVQDMVLSPNGALLYICVLPRWEMSVPYSVCVVDTTQIQGGQINPTNNPTVYSVLVIEIPSMVWYNPPTAGRGPQYQQPTFTGIYGSVYTQGIGITPDGRYLCVSDLYGPVWIVDTNLIRSGINYPPMWLFNYLKPYMNAPDQIPPYAGPFGSAVIAALNVQGEPNSIVASPDGQVWVASGGLCATAHEIWADYSVANVIPPPNGKNSNGDPINGNQVTGFNPASVPPGYTPSPTTLPGEPLEVQMSVGNYPLALSIVQPSLPPEPKPQRPLPQPPIFHWGYYWRNGFIPARPLVRKPFVIDAKPNAPKELPIPLPVPTSIRNQFPYGVIDWPVSRVEFASVMQQLFDLPQPKEMISFLDISSDHWGWKSAQAVSRYIKQPAESPASSFFHTDMTLTRQEATAIIMRILEAQEKISLLNKADAENLLIHLKDVKSIAKPLHAYVATALKHEIVEKLSGNLFNPTGILKRSDIDRITIALKTISRKAKTKKPKKTKNSYKKDPAKKRKGLKR